MKFFEKETDPYRLMRFVVRTFGIVVSIPASLLRWTLDRRPLLGAAVISLVLNFGLAVTFLAVMTFGEQSQRTVSQNLFGVLSYLLVGSFGLFIAVSVTWCPLMTAVLYLQKLREYPPDRY